MIPGIEGPKTSNLPLGTCNRNNHPSKSSNTIMCESQLRQNNWKKNVIFKNWTLQSTVLNNEKVKYASFSASLPALESASALAPSPTEMAVPTCVLGNTEDVFCGHQFICYHVKWCEVLIGDIGQKMVPMCICTHPTSFEAFTIFWWGGKIMKMKLIHPGMMVLISCGSATGSAMLLCTFDKKS